MSRFLARGATGTLRPVPPAAPVRAAAKAAQRHRFWGERRHRRLPGWVGDFGVLFFNLVTLTETSQWLEISPRPGVTGICATVGPLWVKNPTVWTAHQFVTWKQSPFFSAVHFRSKPSQPIPCNSPAGKGRGGKGLSSTQDIPVRLSRRRRVADRYDAECPPTMGADFHMYSTAVEGEPGVPHRCRRGTRGRVRRAAILRRVAEGECRVR